MGPLAAVLALVGAGPASAATVRVRESTGRVNSATLVFVADPGEQNRVTVEKQAEVEEVLTLRVVDSGARLTPGRGCSGGGIPGAAVRCGMHAPLESKSEICGKMCIFTVPGTGWADSLEVGLGGDVDSFDAGGIAFEMNVHAGGGDDRVTTGAGYDEVLGGAGRDLIYTEGGDDTVNPGLGDDAVHLADGGGHVIAEPVPDGNDLVDLGREGWADYSSRTTPLTMHGNRIGARGESDTIRGTAAVSGGSGDDFLEANEPSISGGAGDDVLVGGDGDNSLRGDWGDDRLQRGGGADDLGGGPGSDVLEGGAGDDEIEEVADPGPDERRVVGRDVAKGAGGDDSIALGPGADRAGGGAGDDRLYGRDGDDHLSGGTGDDMIAGEGGGDEMFGGQGADLLRAGRVDEGPESTPYVPPDLGVDEADCGPGRDKAQLNAWDRPTGCEARKLVRQVQIGGVRRNLADGTALLTLEAIQLGQLEVTGPGVRTIRHRFGPSSLYKARAMVTLRPRGRALTELRRRGRAIVALRLDFRPRTGPGRSETRHLALRLKR